MRLLLISTFSPSQNVLSTFGTQCARVFLDMPDLEKIIVLCDYIGDRDEHVFADRLILDRCWKQDSLMSLLIILRKVHNYKPDVIWINLQYTLFGPSILSSFFGLLVIPALKWMGYPVVSILHNYLKAIDLSRLGTNRNLLFKVLFNLVDPIIMKLIFASSKIFVMSKEYFMDLNKRFRSGVVEYIEQDLWDVPSYVDVNLDTSNILIFGVFGTYKKLELLLDLLPEIHSVVPKVRLIIAGQSHPEEPSYLNKTMIRYSNLFESGLVTYRGYVEDADLVNLFHEANVVVLTNSLVAGSSSALRFSSSYGRGVIVPDVDEYGSLNEEEWGILKYSSGNKSDFMKKILNVLNSKELQIDLSKRNYHKAISKKGDFFVKHQRWFQIAHRHNSNKSLVKKMIRGN